MGFIMFSKKLGYYRLLRGLTKAELARRAGLSAMLVSYYEAGKRNPTMETLKKLAEVLGIRVLDFLGQAAGSPSYAHGDFRKKSHLKERGKELVRASVEEYFDRFFTVVEILGGNVLPSFPPCSVLDPDPDDDEKNAKLLRGHLGLPHVGPIPNLVEYLENNGILYCEIEAEENKFFGINGSVNGRPYIAVNKASTAENKRTTILHELTHLMFKWPHDWDEKKVEYKVGQISYAAIFPREDALRELGSKRTSITTDMRLTCQEYGISIQLLVQRAFACGIISQSVCKGFFIRLNKLGQRNIGNFIPKEVPTLFPQLVYRAVSLGEISLSKAAELLHTSYSEVVRHCSPAEVLQ